MKNCLNNQLRNRSGLITALIFFFVNVAFSQNSYPINDPRNPNCPCHKYQKLADEEFKKLLEGNKSLEKEKTLALNEQKKTNTNHNPIHQNKLIVLNPDDNSFHKLPISSVDGINKLEEINEEQQELILSEQKMKRPEQDTKISHHKTAKHWKSKRKKHGAHYKQLKRIFEVSSWDIWKRKRNTTACFHWR